MFNPFLQYPPEKSLDNRRKHLADEAYLDSQVKATEAQSQRTPMGLWIGKLLIRMGEKLTKDDFQMTNGKDCA